MVSCERVSAGVPAIQIIQVRASSYFSNSTSDTTVIRAYTWNLVPNTRGASPRRDDRPPAASRMPVRQEAKRRGIVEATNYCQGARCGITSAHSIASMRWNDCGGGLTVVYVEGKKQWNGREDEKSMIVSYATYIRVPAGSRAGLLLIQPQQQQQ